MVNFGAVDTVPEPFRDRLLHVHNEQVTLMRTTPEENRRIAQWIARKLNRSTAPLRLVLPEGGVSMIDAPGQPFHDPIADEALFSELESQLVQTGERRIVRSAHHINDREFSELLVAQYMELSNSPSGGDDAGRAPALSAYANRRRPSSVSQSCDPASLPGGRWRDPYRGAGP